MYIAILIKPDTYRLATISKKEDPDTTSMETRNRNAPHNQIIL